MPVFVIGDVHGHAEALERIVTRSNPGSQDIVIQLGDCINRGPASFEVVEYWLNFSRCQRFVLGGNHEELMYDYLAESSDAIFDYGGGQTIQSYRRHGWDCLPGKPDSVPPDHLQFYLQTLPWTRGLLVTSHYIFTHAGYDFARTRKQQDIHTLRWGRVTGWSKGLPTVVRGHTPHRSVTIKPGVINVDTGCGLGGRLSCIELESERVIAERTDNG